MQGTKGGQSRTGPDRSGEQLEGGLLRDKSGAVPGAFRNVPSNGLDLKKRGSAWLRDKLFKKHELQRQQRVTWCIAEMSRDLYLVRRSLLQALAAAAGWLWAAALSRRGGIAFLRLASGDGRNSTGPLHPLLVTKHARLHCNHQALFPVWRRQLGGTPRGWRQPPTSWWCPPKGGEDAVFSFGDRSFVLFGLSLSFFSF